MRLIVMIIYSANKGSIDLINEWSVGGGPKHMDYRIIFLSKLKEDEIRRKAQVEQV